MSQPNIRIVVLDPGDKSIFEIDRDGKVGKTLQRDIEKFPDGIYYDREKGHLYGTLMGIVAADGSAYGNDGSIWRMNLDGSDPVCIVPEGIVVTPKQITADATARKLYWCDREGMRVMRCNFDGSQVETLYSSAHLAKDKTDQRQFCVGIAVDAKRRQFYWTQKGHPDAGEGSIRRASMDMPKGETPATRSDVEVLFDNLPEPIDLDLETELGALYWSDRGDLAGGNSVSRAKIGADGAVSKSHEVLVTGLKEAIGFAMYHDEQLLYVASLTGELFRVNGAGSVTQIGKFGALTGMTKI